MSDYISREAALSEVCHGCSIDYPCEPCDPQDCEIKARLEAIPAADVVEVRHGRWIPKNADGSWRVDTCSSCKTDTHYVRYAPIYDYCPHCGARMGEAGNE